MKTVFLVLYLIFILVVFNDQSLIAQQVPDTSFVIKIDEPTYEENGPVVAIDDGHNNFHKSTTGFRVFGDLLKADGYQVSGINNISEEVLKQIDVLVVANALHSSNIGNWKKPVLDAFEPKEINVIYNWVHEGGRLFVVADHMPFAGAIKGLASKFGFMYEDGFVLSDNRQWPPETYRKSDSTLLETSFSEGIDSLAGFTGSALKPPKGAIIIARFPRTHQLLISDVAWQFDDNTTRMSTKDFVLGASKEVGKGKVVFFTEAAMFTAQLAQGKYKVGINSDKAPQNQQFVLNVFQWLSN